MLTVAEVARRMKLSERQIRRLIAARRLRVLRFIGMRAIRIRKTDLRALFAK